MRNILLLFSIVLFIYLILRVGFHLIYFFQPGVHMDLLSIYYWGFRLDFTVLFFLNIPFLFYYSFIYDLVSKKRGKIIGLLIFSVLNIPAIIVNFIDLVYYRYNLRRSSSDLLFVFKDSFSASLTFLVQYSVYFVGFIITGVFLIFLAARTLKSDSDYAPLLFKYRLILFIVIASGGVLMARGLSSRPIMPSTPLLYVEPEFQPLVTNSTFTMAYSIFKRTSPLKLKNDFSDKELDSLFTIKRLYQIAGGMQKSNILIFIMETMPSAYLDKNDTLKAKTPFLDSIMSKSTVFTQAYANGLQSNEGLVALLAGIPPFTDVPYFYSEYSNNTFRGLGTILSEAGYSTSFYYGAEKDHFGFEKLTRILGISKYVSGDDFGNKDHHDGNWGIYDSEFLPFAAKDIKKGRAPFLSIIYNLSTHPPYTIPSGLQNQFKFPFQDDARNSVTYFDYSLSLFFNEIKNEPWYKNTIFVFCADHSAAGLMAKEVDPVSAFHIPVIFHFPGKPEPVYLHYPVQQMDVVPSILEYLKYPHPFMSFGKTASDSLNRLVFNYFRGNYQVMDSNYILGYNDQQDMVAYLYNYKSDPQFLNNLINNTEYSEVMEQLLLHLKAFLQRYNNSLIMNELSID